MPLSLSSTGKNLIVNLILFVIFINYNTTRVDARFTKEAAVYFSINTQEGLPFLLMLILMAFNIVTPVLKFCYIKYNTVSYDKVK